jgi:hypothetical protein
MTEDSKLTKIVIDLPGHWATGGEGIWAKSLGKDLFQIDNIPFHAYGLNLGDIVEAIEPSPELKPQVTKVVKASGHRTLRIIFEKEYAEEQQAPYIKEMKDMGVGVERNNSVLLALDVPPEIDYQMICNHLSKLEKYCVLNYETCEVRIPGTFTCGDKG